MSRPRRAVAGLLLLALAACTDSAEDGPVGPTLDTVAEGRLTACVSPTPRLVVEEEDGTLVGHDVAVLEHVADGLGLPLDLVVVPFDDLVSGRALNGLRCDVGAAGVVADPTLDAVVRSSAPYREVDRLLVTAASGPALVPDTFAGSLGVEAGGRAAAAVAAFPAAEVVRLPSGADLRRALAAGAVDAVVLAGVELPLLRETVPEAAVRARLTTGDRTVLLFALGADDGLVDAVDALLVALEGSATARASEERWLGG